MYAKCPKFKKAHCRFLISDLIPITTYDRNFRPHRDGYKVVYVNGTQPQLIAKLKSAAINFALENNVQIKKLTMQRVLNRIIPKGESEEWVGEAKAYYLELDRLALKGKDEELRSVVMSFISICEDHGIQVFLASRYPVEDSTWFKITA